MRSQPRIHMYTSTLLLFHHIQSNESTMLLILHFGPALKFHHISYLFYELLYSVIVAHMFQHMSYQVYELYEAI